MLTVSRSLNFPLYCVVSKQTQLVSTCTHSLFLCVREPVCNISLGPRDLELGFENQHATSLLGDGQTEYTRGYSSQ